MTVPVEYLFRGGEPVRREDVPPAVLAELRRRVVGDGHRGVSVHDGPVLYSLVIRDRADDGDHVSLAREDVLR